MKDKQSVEKQCIKLGCLNIGTAKIATEQGIRIKIMHGTGEERRVEESGFEFELREHSV